MSSISATPSTLVNTMTVKFVDATNKVVKYEYQGKTRTTNSFQELIERAHKAGITVLYTQPVKRYMAEQSKLRRQHDAAQYDEMCAREDAVQLSVERSLEARSMSHVQANVECDNFDWTLIKSIGPVTALKLYNTGFTQLAHIGEYALGTDVLECICTPTQVSELMHAWEVDRAWTKLGVTIPE